MWYLLSALFLLAVYLFLICPAVKKNPLRDQLIQCPFAHRGLYDNLQVPENSEVSFRQAVQKGFGIELDVRLTKDHSLAVFHDANALRMCGQNVLISDLTLSEVRKLSLLNTGLGILTFKEVLKIIDGKVPLLIEIKSDSLKTPVSLLCQTLLKELEDYRGFYAAESFDPRAMCYFKKHAPKVLRGQLVWNGRKKSVQNFCLRHVLCNFLSRPDFIALEKSCTSVSLKIARLFHPALLAWTVQSAAQWQAIQYKFDQMIFEAFLPQPSASCIRTFEKEEGNLS